MSQFDPANYPTVTPTAADLLLLLQASSGDVKTATVQGLADAAQSLASLNLLVSVISVPTTLGVEQYIVFNSAGALAIALPASSLNSGRGYRYFNKGAGVVTITPNGADTIAGAANLVLAQYDFGDLQSDGLGMWGN